MHTGHLSIDAAAVAVVTEQCEFTDGAASASAACLLSGAAGAGRRRVRCETGTSEAIRVNVTLTLYLNRFVAVCAAIWLRKSGRIRAVDGTSAYNTRRRRGGRAWIRSTPRRCPSNCVDGFNHHPPFAVKRAVHPAVSELSSRSRH
jgi:hypothetical protein